MEVSVLYDFAFILFCVINVELISHVARYAPSSSCLSKTGE